MPPCHHTRRLRRRLPGNGTVLVAALFVAAEESQAAGCCWRGRLLEPPRRVQRQKRPGGIGTPVQEGGKVRRGPWKPLLGLEVTGM